MKIREEMGRTFPERPAVFDAAIDAALRTVHEEAAQERKTARRPGMRRPAMAWAVAACLLLAGTLGVAEGVRRGVFSFLWDERDVLPEAVQLVEQDAASLTVGGTELNVTESAYDGATLRLVLSVRVPEIENQLTASDIWDESSAYGQALSRDGVTAQYSFDFFRLNGEKFGMTGGSGGETVPGELGGEALMYFELNLLELDVPEGDVTVELPVARDAQGETVWLTIPAKATELMRDVTPQESFAIGEGTLTVVAAKLSPLGAYATIRIDFPQGADEEAAIEAMAAWMDFAFVDAQGNEVCPYNESVGWGLPQGEIDGVLRFEAGIRCKPAESYPQELYLAPMGYYGEDGAWCADMAHAVSMAK